MTSIETVSIVIAAVSVVIGVINSIRSNQKAEQQRQTEILMQLYNRMQSNEIRDAYLDLKSREWNDYEEWYSHHNPMTHRDAWNAYITMLAFYNGVGILVQQNLIDLNLVEEMIGFQVMDVWHHSEFIIQANREHPPFTRDRIPWKRPMWQPLEWLNNQIRQRIEQTSISIPT